MFNKTTQAADLDHCIDTETRSLRNGDLDPGEYNKTLIRLEALHKIKAINAKDRISADTKMNVAANLAGIVTILSYERLGIIASKALSFVVKLK
jgi:hypothetical protein